MLLCIKLYEQNKSYYYYHEESLLEMKQLKRRSDMFELLVKVRIVDNTQTKNRQLLISAPRVRKMVAEPPIPQKSSIIAPPPLQWPTLLKIMQIV